MRILRVGDPHVTVRNLEDSEKLMAFILKKAEEFNVHKIEFLGDLMHTHAVIRVEVLDFWQRHFKKLSQGYFVIALVGNHDQPGSKEKEQLMNALNAFKGIEDVTIVSKPVVIDNIGYIPYHSDEGEFLKAASDLHYNGAVKTLVAHQNFTVPLYSDMFNPELVPQEHIITGHIHEQKQMGKVFQVGTPKWDTLTDANESKGVWIYDHNEDGSVKAKQFISTKEVVTVIEKHTIKEGDPEPELIPGAKNYVELVGSTAWINEMKKKYKGLASIKARPSDRKTSSANKEKAQSVYEFLNSAFQPIDGVKKQDIEQYLKEVIRV
ncbi:MAG TPA: hypothetical protein DDY18_07370 [Flavobacterium sp.]|jgi:DNA repair exonuclease SbcCD nuclease subunit|nr:hypothetical protein [Flavobacterium sp.]